MARGPDHYSFNPLPPRISSDYFINPFIARAPDPLSTTNISKVVKLTNSCPMHLNIIKLTFCNPGYIKGYLVNPSMARAPYYHSLDPLLIKNILQVVELIHS